MDNNKMEIDNSNGSDSKIEMEIETTSNNNKIIKSRTFEDLFWAVFNNKYIRNYLFRILQNMKFQGDSIKSFYIGNRQPFNRIIKLSWMVKRKAWGLLKMKIENSLEFPTESDYIDFYSKRDVFLLPKSNEDEEGDISDIGKSSSSSSSSSGIGGKDKVVDNEIIPGSEKDEYLQITAKGVEMLFRECNDMEIIKLLYIKKRDQMNIVGDILKCAVESKNEDVVKLFLEDEQFKDTISTKLALEWCIENNDHKMAKYLFSIDPDVVVKHSKLFSSVRSYEITKFILDNESLYQDVTPKNSLISYKVFIETKSIELQTIMVKKELVGKESLALLDLQNRIIFKKKEIDYNQAIVDYIKMYYKPEEVFQSRYTFFIQQLLFDLLKDSTCIKDAIEKATAIGVEKKVVSFICESPFFIEKFKFDSNFEDFIYLLNKIEESSSNLFEVLFSKLSSLFNINQIKEVIEILQKKNIEACNIFIKNITPIKDITLEDTLSIVESLPKNSNAYLILKSFYIQVAKKGDISGLKSILEFKDKELSNYSSIFNVEKMFNESCNDGGEEDQVERISNFISILISARVPISHDTLLKSIADKFIASDINKFLKICSSLPISPELTKLLNNIVLNCLRKPNDYESNETLAQLLKYSLKHLSSYDIDELFKFYIKGGNIDMLNILLENIPEFFKCQKIKVCYTDEKIIKWFIEKNKNKSFGKLDFSLLLDTLILEQSPFKVIEMVFDYLVSNKIYQLPPNKLKGINGDFISYKAVTLSIQADYEQVFSLLFFNHKLFYWDKSAFSMEINNNTFCDVCNSNILFNDNNLTKSNKKIKKDNKNDNGIDNGNNNSGTTSTPNSPYMHDDLLDYEEDIINPIPTLSSTTSQIITSAPPTINNNNDSSTNNNNNVQVNNNQSNNFQYTFNSHHLYDELNQLVRYGEVKDAIHYLKSKPIITCFPKETVYKIIKYCSLELILEYFSITNYEQLSNELVLEKIFKYGRNDLIQVLFKSHYNYLERSFKKCARFNNFHTVSLLLGLFKNKFGGNKSAHIINLAHQLIKEAIMANDIIIFNILYFNFDFKLSLDSFIQDYSQSDAFHNNYSTVKELLKDIKNSY